MAAMRNMYDLLLKAASLVMVAVLACAAAGCSDSKSGTADNGTTGTTVRPSRTGPVERPSNPSGVSGTSGSSDSSQAYTSDPLAGTTVSREQVQVITPEEVKVQTDMVVLGEVLTSAEDPESRKVAARSIGRKGDFASLPALLEGLSDENPTVRVYSISAINDITNMRYRYDPKAPASIRKKQVDDLYAYFRRCEVIE